jgi:CheY-like chemotaxis protein
VSAAPTRVVVVEDDVLQLRLLRRMLASLGCEVVGEATSLDPGQVLARTGEFDVAILDVNLRGRLSTPIAEVLLERELPFVVVTGYALDERSPRPLASAPRLTKPFVPAALARALEQALAARRPPG